MNMYLKLLPYLEGEEVIPQAMKRADIPFNEIKICMIILRMVPFGLSIAKWTNKGVEHFPVEMRALINDLVLLKHKYKCTQKLLEQVQGQTRGNGKAMASMDNPVPNKD